MLAILHCTYTAFCILKTTNGWFIKSFHSDNKGETASIGMITASKIEKRNEPYPRNKGREAYVD